MMLRDKVILHELFAPVVYDVNNKTAIGIFRNAAICAKYFGLHRESIVQMIDRKSKNKKNVFGVLICVRNANAEQRGLLGEKEWVILEDAFKIGEDYTFYSQFESTRLSLYKKGKDKGYGQKRRKEKKEPESRGNIGIGEMIEYFKQ